MPLPNEGESFTQLTNSIYIHFWLQPFSTAALLHSSRYMIFKSKSKYRPRTNCPNIVPHGTRPGIARSTTNPRDLVPKKGKVFFCWIETFDFNKKNAFLVTFLIFLGKFESKRIQNGKYNWTMEWTREQKKTNKKMVPRSPRLCPQEEENEGFKASFSLSFPLRCFQLIIILNWILVL